MRRLKKNNPRSILQLNALSERCSILRRKICTAICRMKERYWWCPKTRPREGDLEAVLTVESSKFDVTNSGLDTIENNLRPLKGSVKWEMRIQRFGSRRSSRGRPSYFLGQIRHYCGSHSGILAGGYLCDTIITLVWLYCSDSSAGQSPLLGSEKTYSVLRALLRPRRLSSVASNRIPLSEPTSKRTESTC